VAATPEPNTAAIASGLALANPAITMATPQAIEPVRLRQSALQIGVLFGLAVLLVTQDPGDVAPYALLALAFCVGVHGYLRRRP
jgi:hypothetical protein